MMVATLGGVGRLRPGPGTFGSAVVLPLVLLGPLGCLVMASVLAVAGHWAATQVASDPREDPAWFVADEGMGMLIALAALPQPSWLGVAIAFALFRAFDIAKPWPVSWADRQPGALGIMLDDALAGAMAAGLVLLLAQLAPAVLR